MAAKKRKKHPAKKKHAKKTAGGLKTVLGRLSSARKGFKSLSAPALSKVGSTLREDVARVETLEYKAGG